MTKTEFTDSMKAAKKDINNPKGAFHSNVNNLTAMSLEIAPHDETGAALLVAIAKAYDTFATHVKETA